MSGLNTMLLKILAFCVLLNFGAGLPNNEIKFIENFLSQQILARSVMENLCLSQVEKLELQKTVAKYNYRYVTYTDLFLNVNLEKRPYFYVILARTECDLKGFMSSKAIAPLLTFPNLWLVFGDISKIDNIFVPINSIFVMPALEVEMNDTGLATIYKINKKDLQYVKEIINDTTNISIVENRKNFHKMPLRVIYVIQDKDTMNHFTDYRDKHIDSPTKINYVLYNMLCDMLNCTQVRIFTDDWGFETFNKTLNRTVFPQGMFMELMNDRADIAGTVSFTPATRLIYFKYLFAPIKDFSVKFVFRAPPLAYYTNLVVLPFDTLVWFTIGATLILCCILINTIYYWEVKQKQFVEKLDLYEENPPSFWDVVVMQVAVVCQVDFFYEPKSVSGKIATFTVLIFCTFIYTAFSARIVLLLQSNTNMIGNIDTLYATKFDFGVENQLYNQRYFREASDRADEKWRKQIYENKIKKHNIEKFLGADEGMHLVRDSYFAFHIEQTVAHYLIDKSFSNSQKCSLKFIETIYKADNPHLSVPRTSPYIEFFVVSFRRLAETGLHNREYRNCFTKKPSCEGRTSAFVSVGLTESYFAFFVFGWGIFLSIILLLIEILVFKYFKISVAF